MGSQTETTGEETPRVNSVTVDLQERMRFLARGENEVTVAMDAGEQHGGGDDGFSPMELLLVGLGGCTAMDVLSIMRKKRQEVTSYRVEVDGERSGGHPNVFTSISIRHIMRGAALSEEALRRAIELSETKYCPAFAMLSQAATISSTYEILPGSPVD